MRQCLERAITEHILHGFFNHWPLENIKSRSWATYHLRNEMLAFSVVTQGRNTNCISINYEEFKLNSVGGKSHTKVIQDMVLQMANWCGEGSHFRSSMKDALLSRRTFLTWEFFWWFSAHYQTKAFFLFHLSLRKVAGSHQEKPVKCHVPVREADTHTCTPSPWDSSRSNHRWSKLKVLQSQCWK